MWTRRQFLEATGSAAASTAWAAAAAPSARAAATSPDRSPAAKEAASPVAAARDVLRRQLGEHAAAFHLSLLPEQADSPERQFSPERYTLEASAGVVHIAGSGAVAICRAAYSYLRNECGAMITWSGRHLALPTPLPDRERVEVECPYRHVQYLNPCTFGYTMAFWDWERWERELDWMALHGITMPLALEGQEYIWQQVWLSFGLSQAEIDASTTGPAHLPWHRLGNINHFDGPLPQDWVQGRRALQRRILDRMRALGMQPVGPAFSGFVPQGFLRVRPEAQAFTRLWLPDEFKTIPRSTRTFILHPAQEELYREIGQRFIEAYRAEYGPIHYYLADTFNELPVPVTDEHRAQDLERFGKTVFAGIEAGDPAGTWVMQGWLFVYDPAFWTPDAVKAFLGGVPDDRMLILDYSNDLTPSLRDKYAPGPWRRDGAFYGKQWINGMAHTFGGNDNVKGNLALMAAEPAAVLADPRRGNLVGWGICPEGIETNEVVYELMTDAGWQAAPIDLDTWIPLYCRARYGACPPAMRQAWALLLKSAYGAHVWMTKQAWQGEPSMHPVAASVDAGPDFVAATGLFLSCAPQLSSDQASGELYRNDLIEFVVQAAGGYVDGQLALATQALASREPATARMHADQALAMLARMDAVLHLRPDRRLETWVEAARACASRPDEAAYYEENGRLLITTWGWPELSDYASRVWSGLTRDYYAARWRAWFDAQLAAFSETPAEAFSLDLWQQAWLSRPYRPSAPLPVADLPAEAAAMLSVCRCSSAKVSL
jgi:alpha-N-acetylglucosaminidase